MSIRIADDTQISHLSAQFFYFHLSLSCAKHDLLGEQFADSVGKNYSLGFNSNTTSVSFGNFRILKAGFFILQENENIHVSSPRGIKFIFAECKNVLATVPSAKSPKIREN
jgi:hypothetical protein